MKNNKINNQSIYFFRVQHKIMFSNVFSSQCYVLCGLNPALKSTKTKRHNKNIFMLYFVISTSVLIVISMQFIDVFVQYLVFPKALMIDSKQT